MRIDAICRLVCSDIYKCRLGKRIVRFAVIIVVMVLSFALHRCRAQTDMPIFLQWSAAVGISTECYPIVDRDYDGRGVERASLITNLIDIESELWPVRFRYAGVSLFGDYSLGADWGGSKNDGRAPMAGRIGFRAYASLLPVGVVVGADRGFRRQDYVNNDDGESRGSHNMYYYGEYTMGIRIYFGSNLRYLTISYSEQRQDFLPRGEESVNVFSAEWHSAIDRFGITLRYSPNHPVIGDFVDSGSSEAMGRNQAIYIGAQWIWDSYHGYRF